jgi:hypothetical protein
LWIKRDVVEQPAERRKAALYVADGVGSHEGERYPSMVIRHIENRVRSDHSIDD